MPVKHRQAIFYIQRTMLPEKEKGGHMDQPFLFDRVIEHWRKMVSQICFLLGANLV